MKKLCLLLALLSNTHVWCSQSTITDLPNQFALLQPTKDVVIQQQQDNKSGFISAISTYRYPILFGTALYAAGIIGGTWRFKKTHPYEWRILWQSFRQSTNQAKVPCTPPLQEFELKADSLPFNFDVVRSRKATGSGLRYMVAWPNDENFIFFNYFTPSNTRNNKHLLPEYQDLKKYTFAQKTFNCLNQTLGKTIIQQQEKDEQPYTFELLERYMHTFGFAGQKIDVLSKDKNLSFFFESTGTLEINSPDKNSNIKELSKVVDCACWNPAVNNQLLIANFTNLAIYKVTTENNQIALTAKWESEEHTACVLDAKFSPNGSYIAVLREDKIIDIFKITKDKIIHSQTIKTSCNKESKTAITWNMRSNKIATSYQKDNKFVISIYEIQDKNEKK